jgi:lipopolysaccharide/colanic/teichoic acid biosynthesis glycosyltransferase
VTRLARPLLYGGVVVAVVGLSKLHALELGTYDYTGSSRFGWSLAYIALIAVTAYALGLPDIPRTRRSAIGSSVLAAGSAAIAMSTVQLLAGDALLPRFVVFGSALILVPWFMLCVNVAADGRILDERRDRVLIVADRAEATYLTDELEGVPEASARVVAQLAPADAGLSASGRRPVTDAATRHGATVVVLDRAAQEDTTIVSQVADLHVAGLRVRTLSLFYEEWLGKLPVSELERVSMMFDIGEVHRQRYARMSRIVDVGLGAVGLLALALLTPVVMIGNRFANRGPLLYRQDRVGRDGRPFRILKFRTMRAEPGGPSANEWTAEADPRITSFGRWLRVSHLDELPQVVNILRGDLAVVGPRPEQPRYVEELSEKLPFYAMRHLVRPGLTGWAQVKYGYAGDERDALEKLQYEFFYLRRQSMALDLRIVVRTVRSVLGGEGAGR